jgi:DNA-binding NarL/FixJ family response regulator
MPETIRILIVDDHPVVRAGLHAFLTLNSGIEVVGEAVDGPEAIAKAHELQPDIVLIDMVMPGEGGLAAIKAIRRENTGIRILVLSSFGEDERVFPAIKAGALGYMLKDSSPQELLTAIRQVYKGQSCLDSTIARELMHELAAVSDATHSARPLTDRELEILGHVARGLSNQEIAVTLSISERTVRTHVSNILDKLHVSNRTQATLYALRERLTNLEYEAEAGH